MSPDAVSPAITTTTARRSVRYPRGNAVGVELAPLEHLPIGKGIVKRHGEKVAILNFGTLMPEAAIRSQSH